MLVSSHRLCNVTNQIQLLLSGQLKQSSLQTPVGNISQQVHDVVLRACQRAGTYPRATLNRLVCQRLGHLVQHGMISV